MSKHSKKQSAANKQNDLAALRARDAEKKAKAAAEKKRRRSRILTRAGAAAAAILVLCGAVFAVSRSGFLMRSKVVAETEHYAVNAAMFSCYFRQCAESYRTAAASDPNLQMFDAGTSLRKQEYSSDKTWFDQFLDNTMSSVQNNLRLCEAAYAAGYALNDEQEEQCRTIAAKHDLSYYPKGIRQADVEEATRITLLAEEYRKSVTGQMDVTEDEIAGYYEQHAAEYQTASLLGYSFPWSPEGVINGDAAEYNAASAAADALAECKSEKEYSDYIRRYLTEQKEMQPDEAAQVMSDLVITKYVRDFPQSVQEWLSGGAKAGETLLLPVEDQCYISVYMVRTPPAADDSETADFRVILLNTKNYDDSLEQTKAFAESLMQEVQSADDPQHMFAERAQHYSRDSSASAGGLIQGYAASRTTYGDETAAWLFDAGRKPGDMTMISRGGAVLLLYYQGVNHDPGWKNQIRRDLYNSKYKEFSEACAQHEVTLNEENYKYIQE